MATKKKDETEKKVSETDNGGTPAENSAEETTEQRSERIKAELEAKEQEALKKFNEQQEAAMKEKEELRTKLEESENEKKQVILEAEELRTKTDEMLKEVQERIRKDIEGTTGRATIFKKIGIVLLNVQRVPKSGWNDFHKYKYATESDIVDGIRPLLAEAGLALWTTVAEQTRELKETFDRYGKSKGMKTFTKVKLKFIVGCADTGATLESEYWGEGEDEGDKGLYKAYTGAQKYFLSKTFLISAGDMVDDKPTDPEADTKYTEPQQQRQQQPSGRQNQPQNNKTNGDKAKLFGQYKIAKNGTGTPEEFERLYTNAMKSGMNHKVFEDFIALIAKWVKLGGDTDSFETFYNKQLKKNVGHKQMHDFLDNQIAEKLGNHEQKEPSNDKTESDDFYRESAEAMNFLNEEQKQELIETGQVDFNNNQQQ